MAQQLSDIRTDVREAGNYSSSDGNVSDAVMTRVINRALRRISAEFDWPWLYAEETITTVAGTTDYNLPTRWAKTAWLSEENVGLLRPATHKQSRRWIEQATRVTGRPVYYTHEGASQIRLFPAPDAVYSVDHGYYTYEAALSNDTDTPAIPDPYDDLVVWKSLEFLAIRRGEQELMQNARRMYQDQLRVVTDNVRASKEFASIKTRQDW
jgi:hypothetical protein